MKDPVELALVVKALTCRVVGCVEWHPDELERVRRDPDLQEWTPESIQQELIDFVAGGGIVKQVKETRRPHRDFYYKVILPCPEVFPRGLFVEMELRDKDSDLPEVWLVNAHEQK